MHRQGTSAAATYSTGECRATGRIDNVHLVGKSGTDVAMRAANRFEENGQTIDLWIWRRTEDDTNGVYGAWYVDVPMLVETFGAAVVTEKLAAYAAAQARARAAAIAAADEPPAEADVQ